jgi:protein-disulfide isomerase
MNMHSLLQKIIEMTNPKRFLTPKSRKSHVPFVGRNFVVSEYFGLGQLEIEDKAEAHRRAIKQYIATPGAPAAENVHLQIKMMTEGGWAVTLQQGTPQGNAHLVCVSGEPAKMIALYKRLYAQMIRDDQVHAQSQVRLMRWAVALIGIIALYASLAIVGGFTGGNNKQAAMHLADSGGYGLTPEQIALLAASNGAAQQGMRAPGMPGATPPSPPLQANPQGEQLSDAERKAVATKGSKIAMGGAGGEVTIFTDPKCPFCQRLEESIDEVVKAGKAKPVLVPVAFKDGSRALIASVLCSKDPVASWKKVVRTGEPAGPACEAGLKKVDQNNKLFEELRLSATPTMLSPKGLVAAGFATGADLTLFAQH